MLSGGKKGEGDSECFRGLEIGSGRRRGNEALRRNYSRRRRRRDSFCFDREETYIRIAPPLVISEAEIDEGIKIIESILKDIKE